MINTEIQNPATNCVSVWLRWLRWISWWQDQAWSPGWRSGHSAKGIRWLCWLLQRLKKMVMNHWWLVMLRTSIVNLKYCESESEIYLKQKIWPGLMTKVLPRQSPLPEACLRPPCIYLIVDNIDWEDQHIITCKIDLGSSSTMERSTKCD